jgi:ATP-dependent DNA helicase DinG
VSELSELFGSEGALANIVTGYRPRTGQIEMAEKIAYAISTQQNLIAEAGTGTGKTFAYLIPAILAGKKTIISTGTKIYRINYSTKICP